MAAVRQWGDFTQAYSTATQSGLSHFWHDGGYIAYQVKWRTACALGDPVAAPEAVEPLLAAFLARFRRRCFWQISRGTAEVLERLGLWINEMGCDTRIELAYYDFNGKRKERLRHATNWLEKHGYAVREGRFALNGDGGDGVIHVDAEEIGELSAEWQQTRRIRGTVRFFNRPMVLADEPDVRKFFLFGPDHRCAAFIFFDPIYRAGRVVGYSPAIKRRAARAPLRSEEGIMKVAIEQFQHEGRERVMLGPLAAGGHRRSGVQVQPARALQLEPRP